jgi:23S rRNA (cytosine1962-C5)-methyltransferase
MISLPVAILKPKREKSLLRRHPWIFSGAIEEVKGKPDPGSLVVVADKKGNRYGVGSYSPFSQILIRMWSFDPQVEINSEYFEQVITRAVAQRATGLQNSMDNARRLVFGESDQLPGLIVDRYAHYLVAQFLTTGAVFFKKQIVAALNRIFPTCYIYERSDEEVRRKENLPLFKGSLVGTEPPDLVQINEQDNHFWVDLKNGHKTGFYLDQRENRLLVKGYARGNEILNCFSYTGGFCIPCLQAGALSITNIDSSESALDLLTKNLHLNHQDPNRVENIAGDVFQILRRFRNTNRPFDMIILDPPRFADSRQQVAKAARGYKDINWLALRLIKPGGVLVTFSCSGSLSPDLFQKIVADAALDAGRFVQIIHNLMQADDHPVALNFPEAAYLKGFICRVF